MARWVAQLHGGTLRFLDPEAGQGARIRLEVPGERATAVLASPTPVPSAVSAVVPPTVAVPETTPRPQSGLDAVFGRFWPDRAAPHGLRTVVAAAGAGLVAGIALSFTAVGITWTLVAMTCGAAALATARRRREPWTLLCAGLAVLLVLPMTLLAAWWVQMLGLVVAAAVFLCGVTGARTLPGILLSGMAWPLASLRGLPWFGRVAPDRRHRVAHAGRGAYDGVVAAGSRRLRHDLRQRQPRLRVVGRPARAQPDLQRPRRPGLPGLLRLRRHPRRRLPRTQPRRRRGAGRATTHGARQPLRVARPGARRRRRVPRLHRRAGAGAGRRTRLHRGRRPG